MKVATGIAAIAFVVACVVPLGVSAAVEGVLLARITFVGECEGDGVLVIRNTTRDTTIVDEQVHWSADEPVEEGTQFGYGPGDRYLIRLLDSSGSVVFESADGFVETGDERQFDVRFSAVVDCSATPYVELLSDTAVMATYLPPRWLTVVGVVLLLAAIGGLMIHRPPRSTLR